MTDATVFKPLNIIKLFIEY